jgi:hypothetical protein
MADLPAPVGTSITSTDGLVASWSRSRAVSSSFHGRPVNSVKGSYLLSLAASRSFTVRVPAAGVRTA